VTDETSAFPYLLSTSSLLLLLAAFYVGRALWIARREWPQCGADTKILYLLVAPALTLAVDLLEFTDRLFWSGLSKPVPARRAKPALAVARLRTKPAMRS
jgi:hypothetical protein